MHQAGNAGEFVRVVGDEDSARSPGDRGDPEVGLADEGACLFEGAADVNIVLHRRDIRPRDGEWLEDVVHLMRVMLRPRALCRSEFQLREHLEWDYDFTGSVPEKLLPHMIGTTAEAGDEDVRIDESGHLRHCIEGFHGDGKRALRSMERRVYYGTDSRQPFGGVSRCWNLVRIGGEAVELLRRPVRQRLVVVRREGVQPQLQPIIEIEDEGAHGWQSMGSAGVFKEQSHIGRRVL